MGFNFKREIDGLYINTRWLKTTLISLKSFSLIDENRRVIRLAQPLVRDDQVIGMLIWELKLTETFLRLIPNSLRNSKHSFIQYRDSE